MITIQVVVLVCWIVFWLYWLISAVSVKPTQKTKGPLAGNWQRILLLIGFWFMTGFRFKFFGRLGLPADQLAIPLIPHTLIVEALIVILMIAGLVIAILARRTLAANWSGAVVLKKDHELITTGLYHYVRHPIYTGILTMAFATALMFGTLSACIGFLVILLGIWLKLKEEEALMIETFADEYLSYKKHTRILIPFLW